LGPAVELWRAVLVLLGILALAVLAFDVEWGGESQEARPLPRPDAISSDAGPSQADVEPHGGLATPGRGVGTALEDVPTVERTYLRSEADRLVQTESQGNPPPDKTPQVSPPRPSPDTGSEMSPQTDASTDDPACKTGYSSLKECREAQSKRSQPSGASVGEKCVHYFLCRCRTELRSLASAATGTSGQQCCDLLARAEGILSSDESCGANELKLRDGKPRQETAKLKKQIEELRSCCERAKQQRGRSGKGE
jgi:hypothetical protein